VAFFTKEGERAHFVKKLSRTLTATGAMAKQLGLGKHRLPKNSK
jgi:hypothetical protein